jgi:2,4-dienoyl-CoA reductase-like NADH-dependent reductase (Old Yellow Enzyme family)
MKDKPALGLLKRIAMTDTTELPLLFQPLKLRSLELKNRIVVAPMCQYASVDGMPTPWHYAHLGRYAIGGAAVVFYEETAVEARGRKTYECAALWDDAQTASFASIASMLKSLGSIPAMQLGHSGRKASVKSAMNDWEPLGPEDAALGSPPWTGVSPSPLRAAPGKHIPKEMDGDDIRQVIAAFVEATRRTADAGFEILEIHGAHGYLLHQFLSPLSNLRNDGYGGDRNGRMRFVLELTEAVRDAWPNELPLFFRVSSIDGKGGAWDIEDTVALSSALASRGVDVVDCSSGGITGDSQMPAVPALAGNQVSFAHAVKRDAGMRSLAVGLITEPHQAEGILQAGHADLIGMARELMYHADWPVHAAGALGIPDYLSLFPSSYAHRLISREAALSRG